MPRFNKYFCLKSMSLPSIGLLLIAVLLSGCAGREEKLFKIHSGKAIGIDFKNSIITSDTFNALTFEYIYNGAGVGVGDFNNDGLEDLFFGGNQVTSKLYLNNGGLKFNDITKQAGVETDRWVTGVSVVDINHDGLLDIFLAVAGNDPGKMRDLLFINQGIENGIPTFIESARSYGIDDEGYGTMGAFLDYDKDGDLDLYILTNALESFNRNNLRPRRVNGEASSTDRLYRNNGNNTFTNVSREAGILIEGYGLGVNISDINQDSWPDIYVANDFLSNDLIWINQQDGTFKNMAGDYLKHQTHNGMGVDVADFNNDELQDIIVVDMLPPGHERQKMMTGGQNYDVFHMSESMGYEAQYMRNTLQLNRGKFGNKMLFSEIAFLGGISATDWSWAPLFADFDNDGWKDLFVANGYRKDVTNLDFIFFGLKNASPFGTKEARQEKFNKELNELPEVKLSNYVFRNTGTLAFSDHTEQWGMEFPAFSNGAVYADFDRDGDLDLVTNNIDDEVTLYENRSDGLHNAPHYLQIAFADSNVFLNQKVWVYAEGKVQFQELTPYRGFQSSVTSVIHFGLGSVETIDSLKVVWPDNMTSLYYNIRSDTTLYILRKDAAIEVRPAVSEYPFRFEETASIDYTHCEKSSADIKATRTLLHELSSFGPCAAKGDVNGDNLEDLFIGGEIGSASALYIQQPDGQFTMSVISSDKTREDGDALFFDADNDGDADLYVGASCASGMEDAKKHLLYTNDGNGNFKLSSTSLPEITSSASCVVAADYDNDGDLDLFVGGRIKPREYPFSPRSYILQNTNGIFKDVTSQLNPALESPGMVTSVVWADVNKDDKQDLIIAGEWMPIRIFINNGQGFSEETKGYGLENSHGWWNCLRAADLNEDGYIDIIAGNTGKNSFFQPSSGAPVTITAADFDKNGSIDPIVSYFNPIENDRYIIHNRLVLIDQVPGFKRRFETFSQYATTPFMKSFSEEEFSRAVDRYAYDLSSIVLVNDGGDRLKRVELPDIAQISSMNDVLIEDLNNDRHWDLIIVGNEYGQETLFGRYDASIGTVLMGDGKLGWKEFENRNSNFVADKNAKEVLMLQGNNTDRLFVIINNDGPVQTYKLQDRSRLSGVNE